MEKVAAGFLLMNYIVFFGGIYLGSVFEALAMFCIGIGAVVLQFIVARRKDVPVNGALALFIFLLFSWTGIYAASPGLMRAPAFSQFTGCQSKCRNIGAALELYRGDNEGSYPDSLSRLTPDYISEIPTCPSSGDDTYSESYTSRNDSARREDSRYTFYCRGTNHSAVNVPMNFPRYTSSGGLERGGRTSLQEEITMFQFIQLILLLLTGWKMKEYKYNNLIVGLILGINAVMMLVWYFVLLPGAYYP